MLLTPALAPAQSPVDFGLQEVRRVLAERGSSTKAALPEVEYSTALPADGFQIKSGIVAGGSRRGVMYGLLEAADQLLERSAITNLKATPRIQIRGAWLRASDLLLERSDREWGRLFEGLAQARFNRLRLDLPSLDAARVARLTAIARVAEAHAVDLAVGLQTVDSALVLKLFGSSIVFKAVCPPSSEAMAAILALSEVGRYATVDLPASAYTPEIRQEAAEQHVPLRLLSDLPTASAAALWRSPVTPPAAGLNASVTGYEAGPLGEDWTAAARQLRGWTPLSFIEERGKAEPVKKAAPKKAKKPAKRR